MLMTPSGVKRSSRVRVRLQLIAEAQSRYPLRAFQAAVLLSTKAGRSSLLLGSVNGRHDLRYSGRKRASRFPQHRVGSTTMNECRLLGLG